VHYYKFNIPAWGLSTSHLSLEEEAIYFRLVNFYYDSEQPIPLETQSVFRRLRITTHEKAAMQILGEYFTKTKKGYVHDKCEEILNEYAIVVGKNRDNGKKGGRPRKIKPLEETQTKPTGFSDETQGDPKDNLNYSLVPIKLFPTDKRNPYPSLNSLKGIDFSAWPTLPTKETMEQWLQVRKSKKASNTQIAMDAVATQVVLADEQGVNADQCIQFSVERSWSGFKLEWVSNEINKDANTRLELAKKFVANQPVIDKITDRSWAEN
jgi:uncharacterized protein YdaU (DUF1376 family)